MVNLEPLKNLNKVLTQAIDVAENDPSLGKILEFAARAAKEWNQSSSNPWATLEPREEQPSSHTRTVNSLEKIQTLNSTVNSLGDLVDTVNHLGKQMAKVKPFLTALMKIQPPDREPRRPEKSHSAGKREPSEKAVADALVSALLPVLLLNLAFRSR